MDLTLAFFLKSETYSFIPEPVLFCLWKYSHQKSVVILLTLKYLSSLSLMASYLFFPLHSREG